LIITQPLIVKLVMLHTVQGPEMRALKKRNLINLKNGPYY
jgi:hypothetical protein